MSLLNRRSFLRTGLIGSLVVPASFRLASAAPSSQAEDRRLARESGRAKNVIFLVSDGMSLGTLTLAERHLRRQEGRGTHWLQLYSRPGVRRALMDTSSASSLVTDSAAASSAWGCGFKVANGAINYAPDGRPYDPILRLARASGRSTGLVSTAQITHATPAGFAAQATARSEETEIAVQYLEEQIDVLLGGGVKFFDPALRKDKRDLYAEFASAGYQTARTREQLLAAPVQGTTRGSASRILGTFADGHVPYTLDHRADATLRAEVPTLAEMSRAALQRLALNPRGFVLQIEGARVDHAAHANDLGGLIFDQLAFDDAVAEVVRFVEGRDDTLVIITSDHGNANPGLNGTGGSFDSRGGSYGDTQKCFDRLVQFKQTNSWIIAGLDKDSSFTQIRDRVREANGITLLEDEADLLRRALRKDPSPREAYRVRNTPIVTLGQLVANYTSVGWTGTQHTTDYTELAAFGPGSEPIQGLVQNNDLFHVMTHALGLAVPQAAKKMA